MEVQNSPLPRKITVQKFWEMVDVELVALGNRSYRWQYLRDCGHHTRCNDALMPDLVLAVKKVKRVLRKNKQVVHVSEKREMTRFAYNS